MEHSRAVDLFAESDCQQSQSKRVIFYDRAHGALLLGKPFRLVTFLGGETFKLRG